MILCLLLPLNETDQMLVPGAARGKDRPHRVEVGYRAAGLMDAGVEGWRPCYTQWPSVRPCLRVTSLERNWLVSKQRAFT